MPLVATTQRCLSPTDGAELPASRGNSDGGRTVTRSTYDDSRRLATENVRDRPVTWLTCRKGLGICERLLSEVEQTSAQRLYHHPMDGGPDDMGR